MRLLLAVTQYYMYPVAKGECIRYLYLILSLLAGHWIALVRHPLYLSHPLCRVHSFLLTFVCYNFHSSLVAQRVYLAESDIQ